MAPLSGIRVIDLTTVAMGPLASQWLGDLGADVIKVEAPEGDSTRRTGPAIEQGMAALFISTNRNKRSIALDLKTDAGRDALLSLIDSADVFMHNIRPQKLAGLGLGHVELLKRNPKLVYAGLHGFGESGPYGGKPAYDDIIQALSGCADLMGKQNGVPGYYPSIIADKTTGLIAAIAILSAIIGRQSSGEGVVVEIPMFECMTAFNLVEHLYGHIFNPPVAPLGYPRVLSKDRRPLRTRDGYVCMMPYTDSHWRAFFKEVGASELIDDPRFSSIGDRTQHIDELYKILSSYLLQRDSFDWLTVCEKLGIPAAPIRSLDDLLKDQHLEEVNFFQSYDDQSIGGICTPGVPILINGERPKSRIPPRLGEHGREILQEIGYDQEKLNRLLRSGTAQREKMGSSPLG
ncbi:CoA transferase [Kineobactrum salinum]|uniref:CoA transferase n=1 Tax=Kineobactrum salinum TaxID=2708301 RepID=A0A6C0U610_9GAMM|nr:CoA transferase [Kineobactrum salinum]